MASLRRLRSARSFACFAATAFLFLAGDSVASGNDRYVGYYYPPPISTEVYTARAETLAEADRNSRTGFVIGFNRELRLLPYPPQYAIFAKGGEADKLIIVGLNDGYLDTIYRVRALLALLTAQGRGTKLFRELGVETYFTFLDFAKLFGFKSVTVTDGDRFAHQVTID